MRMERERHTGIVEYSLMKSHAMLHVYEQCVNESNLEGKWKICQRLRKSDEILNDWEFLHGNKIHHVFGILVFNGHIYLDLNLPP